MQLERTRPKNDLSNLQKMLLGLVACGCWPAFAQNISLVELDVPDFTTSSATVVDVPGSTLLADPRTGDHVLVFAEGNLTAEGTGNVDAQLQIIDTNLNEWMSVAAGAVSTPQSFVMFDASTFITTLHAQLHAVGGMAKVTDFKMWMIVGLTGTQLVELSAPSIQYGDVGYHDAVTVTLDTGTTWAALACGDIRSLTAGVPVAMRLADNLGGVTPRPIDGDAGNPSSFFLTTSPGYRQFFAPLVLSAGQSSLALQVAASPSGVANTAEVKNARIFVYPVSQLPPQASMRVPNTTSTGPDVPFENDAIMTLPNSTYLVVGGGMFESDNGQSGLHMLLDGVTTRRVIASPAGDQLALAYFQTCNSLAATSSLPLTVDVFSPVPPALTLAFDGYWGALGPFTGGFTLLTDAGPSGAGTSDAGAADAGAPDAGATDGGTGAPDGGGVDAGGLDAGGRDAGAPDAGPGDAGARDAGAPDGGSNVHGPYALGCGCQSDGGEAGLALLLLGLLTRPGLRSRRRPRESSR